MRWHPIKFKTTSYEIFLSPPSPLSAGHQSDVEVVRWHPNCHNVASGSADRTVRLWDIRTGTCCRVFVGHRATVSD